ncbi:MAG TPA: glycine--tRNA ligase subunit beta [Deltaproteobacteria bacterium]|nr:glycine--tRNA ligase subunit beta [Deltaproteobacteria bacterium]HRW80239.1 glycine--tRNA ligase subunit beta [Desulfomonilia bacterium]HNQ86290.1 glycine--tRNA ligase subunit beta [Deltaproteobacteria bacterium]HNS90505.1 glycine--tRNA ligase subunit beta [Deltaproteobacteria bacterium]HOC76642.1 glycine--tRNA ligase subunit beta [Deltaproteobacteria bacterium]
MARTLLFEIGTEEIPSGFIVPALNFMKSFMGERLTALRLDHEDIRVFSTPRRLALKVSGIAETLPDATETKTGPPKSIAFDKDGNPTKAGLGFAQTCGVNISEVTIARTPKGEYLSVTRTTPGRPAREVLPALLEEMIPKIPFTKTMRWSNQGVRFARPVHWILALFGIDVLPVAFGDISSGRVTFGNRFMAREPLEVADPETYEQVLDKAHVIPDLDKRKHAIWSTLENEAKKLGAEIRDRDLLDEVANLLEYPHPIIGTFDEDYLTVPSEVLVTVMKHHQRYFPMYVSGDRSKLKACFGAFSNIVPKDDAVVRAGNERVLKARLDDGRYFFVEDLKVPLAVYADRLRDVIFHKDLGTSWEKVQRFSQVALALAERIAPEKKDKVKEAASLCKADLNSLMVCELPELQGIMGKEYALRQGIDPEVAVAIREHYLPASADDVLPSGVVGDIVGVADRVDTICGCFGVGMVPSGTSDPYALRRQTIAIENILLGKGYRISVGWLVDKSLHRLEGKLKRPAAEVKQEVVAFFANRFVSILQAKGIPGDVIESVIGTFDDPVDTLQRALALSSVRKEPWFEPICAASKRVENILKKAATQAAVDPKLLAQDEEKALHKAFSAMEQPFLAHTSNGRYTEALKLLAGLKEPIDSFFDKVLVMSEDVAVRENRVALLKGLVSLFDKVAKFSKISTQ